MYPYQQQYQPRFRDYWVGQAPAGAAPAGPAAPPAPAAAPAGAPAAPGKPAAPSVGVRVAETVLTVGFSAAVVYTGIQAGLKQKGINSVAGWVAGVGGGILGLATLTGIASPSLAQKINPFRFA